MANRLAEETSPYLLQHANNPVDWYPWTGEALDRAAAEDKPILLSIGYAACHWCHVMAHESFEDAETAAYMNEHFINIKVDREERPDLDNIYMSAVVAMTGQGGWPMTIMLTPDREPFFGGTYFPPTPRYGMPGFKQVLVSVAQAWQERRQEVVESAETIAQHIGRELVLSGDPGALADNVLTQAVSSLGRSFDSQNGGFGRAPKFPQAMAIEFLLRYSLRFNDKNALTMAEETLVKMARGGIYDQLGGGFARYSTDDRWLVPHFEKMLYDNALLSRVYLHAWRITANPIFRRIVEETLDWALVEMRHNDGGFYSSMDADSEGEEGKFYTWQEEEINELLGENAEPFRLFFGVREGGNWEGKNILHVNKSLEEVSGICGREVTDIHNQIGKARRRLYRIRARRVWPGRDDKVLTAWNGLLLASLAEAGRDLGRADYTEAAVANAAFLHSTMRDRSGRLFRTWRDGLEAKYNGFLEDYAFLADGLLALYEATFDSRWYMWAHELVVFMVDHFRDISGLGFFDTSDDHETLLFRPKDLQDNAIPSGNAMVALSLLRLSLFDGQRALWEMAEEMISAMTKALIDYPIMFAHWLCAADFLLSQPMEVAIVGNPDSLDSQALLATVYSAYRPSLVVAAGIDDQTIPLLAGRSTKDGQAQAYVCRRFVCDAPVSQPEELAQKLA